MIYEAENNSFRIIEKCLSKKNASRNPKPKGPANTLKIIPIAEKERSVSAINRPCLIKKYIVLG